MMCFTSCHHLAVDSCWFTLQLRQPNSIVSTSRLGVNFGGPCWFTLLLALVEAKQREYVNRCPSHSQRILEPIVNVEFQNGFVASSGHASSCTGHAPYCISSHCCSASQVGSVGYPAFWLEMIGYDQEFYRPRYRQNESNSFQVQKGKYNCSTISRKTFVFNWMNQMIQLKYAQATQVLTIDIIHCTMYCTSNI